MGGDVRPIVCVGAYISCMTYMTYEPRVEAMRGMLAQRVTQHECPLQREELRRQ